MDEKVSDLILHGRGVFDCYDKFFVLAGDD